MSLTTTPRSDLAEPRAGRTLEFSPTEYDRLRVVCRDLGTSMIEFTHFAVMQAIDECEAEIRLGAQRRAYYAGPKR